MHVDKEENFEDLSVYFIMNNIIMIHNENQKFAGVMGFQPGLTTEVGFLSPGSF